MENNKKSNRHIEYKQEPSKENVLLTEVTNDVNLNVIKERIIKAFREDIPLAIDITKELEDLPSEILSEFFESLEISFPELLNESEYQSHVSFCLARRGLFDGAKLRMTRAIELAPTDFRYLWWMSEILHKIGDDDFLNYKIHARELINNDLSLLKFTL